MDGVTPDRWRSARRLGWMLADVPDEALIAALIRVGVDAARIDAARARQGSNPPPLAETLLEERVVTDSVLREAMRVARDAPTVAMTTERRIGHYLVKEQIGTGGSGTVWKAWDERLSRWVAIKMLKLATETAQARFAREARVLAAISHPHLLAIHEVGRTDDGDFLVMELIAGTPLDQVPCSLPDACRWVAQISRAVHFVHSKGIVHRDIKPQNILLDLAGQARLVDFGLALSLDSDTLTRTGAVMGTPAFMSPEQAKGDSATASPRTDVYGLGATLYFLCTHRLPVGGATPEEVAARVVQGQIRAPRDIVPGFDPALETIILKAMSSRPMDRYSTAGELADDLEAWVRREPIRARRPGWMRRHPAATRRLLGGALALIFAVGAWLVYSSVQRSREFDRLATEARSAFAARQWEVARDFCRRALALKPDASIEKMARESHQRIAMSRTREKFLTAAKAIEERIREFRHDLYVPSVDIGARRDALEKALTGFHPVLLDPETGRLPEAWTLAGIGWYFAGDLDKAEEDLLRAERLGSDDRRNSFHLAKICLERSMICYSEDPDAPLAETEPRAKAWIARAQEYLRKPGRTDEDISPLDRFAGLVYEAMANDAFDEALRLCSQGLARFGDTMGAEEFLILTGWLEALVDNVRSRDALDRAILRKPHDGWARFLRAGNREREGDQEGAIEDYRAALRVRPRFVEVLDNLAGVLHRMKKIDEALGLYARAIELRPDLAVLYYNRGHSRKRIQDYPGALADYTQAIGLNPKMFRAYVNRGNVHASLADPDRAILDYNRALELIPRDADAIYNRGNAYREKGEPARAIEDYDAALAIDPEMFDAYFARGMARHNQKDFDGAIKDYEIAFQKAPKDWAFRVMAEYALSEGRKGRALPK